MSEVSTRNQETDLLRPTNLVQRYMPLRCAGAVRLGWQRPTGSWYLEEQGVGFDAGVAKVPIVAGTVISIWHMGTARPGLMKTWVTRHAKTQAMELWLREVWAPEPELRLGRSLV